MDLTTAEIVCLGNELLIGVTTNTNATYIGDKLTKLGIEVRRITCIRDDLILAVEFFLELFQRKPDIIIVSGGLGPTYDDIQMEVLSKATNIELVSTPSALEEIEKYYKSRNLDLTEEREKMAYLPINATVFDNDVGSAPGCYFEYDGMGIYCLQGVPTEMEDIMSRHVVPKLKEMNHDELFEEKFQIFGCVESQLAPYINDLKTEFMNLYIKSHPAYKDKQGIVIHISGVGHEAKSQVNDAASKLREHFKNNFPNARIIDLEE
ncbi:MAG: putative competence-damage inducible protein [Candidatus Heimdallarchaeota archaeon AB_125]|nr:MAG: putative competence-damage inducible protein [Candidatus Heimdallarchaeota archaeon AB_125]